MSNYNYVIKGGKTVFLHQHLTSELSIPKKDHNNLEPLALGSMWFEILISCSYLNNSFQGFFWGGVESIQCLECDTVNYLECFVLWRTAQD